RSRGVKIYVAAGVLYITGKYLLSYQQLHAAGREDFDLHRIQIRRPGLRNRVSVFPGKIQGIFRPDIIDQIFLYGFRRIKTVSHYLYLPDPEKPQQNRGRRRDNARCQQNPPDPSFSSSHCHLYLSCILIAFLFLPSVSRYCISRISAPSPARFSQKFSYPRSAKRHPLTLVIPAAFSPARSSAAAPRSSLASTRV